jgi:hypothetical protein
VTQDAEIVAVMEDQRKLYEESEEEIVKQTRISKQEEIDKMTLEISKRFDRLQEKKLLQLQLRAMRLELKTLLQMIGIKKQNDKKVTG